MDFLLFQAGQSKYVGSLLATVIAILVLSAIIAFALWYYMRKRSGK